MSVSGDGVLFARTADARRLARGDPPSQAVRETTEDEGAQDTGEQQSEAIATALAQCRRVSEAHADGGWSGCGDLTLCPPPPSQSPLVTAPSMHPNHVHDHPSQLPSPNRFFAPSTLSPSRSEMTCITTSRRLLKYRNKYVTVYSPISGFRLPMLCSPLALSAIAPTRPVPRLILLSCS